MELEPTNHLYPSCLREGLLQGQSRCAPVRVGDDVVLQELNSSVEGLDPVLCLRGPPSGGKESWEGSRVVGRVGGEMEGVPESYLLY